MRDIKGKLTAATESLDAFCGDQFNAAGVMLARYNVLFDVCTSLLGSPFEGDYKKNQRFLEKSWSWDEKWTWKHPNTFLS